MTSRFSLCIFYVYKQVFIYHCFKYHISRTDRMISIRIKIEITFIFWLHRCPIQLVKVSSCRPFVNMLTSSAGLVGCWDISSVAQRGLLTDLKSSSQEQRPETVEIFQQPTRPADDINILTKGLQELHNQLNGMKMKPENNGNCNFESVSIFIGYTYTCTEMAPGASLFISAIPKTMDRCIILVVFLLYLHFNPSNLPIEVISVNLNCIANATIRFNVPENEGFDTNIVYFLLCLCHLVPLPPEGCWENNLISHEYHYSSQRLQKDVLNTNIGRFSSF